MLKRFICWCRGHDYVMGYGRKSDDFIMGEGQMYKITVCTYCGTRSIKLHERISS